MRKILLVVLCIPLFVNAQYKPITLDDIYKKGHSGPKTFRASAA